MRNMWEKNLSGLWLYHCVRSYFWSEYRKIWTRNNSVFGHSSCSVKVPSRPLQQQSARKLLKLRLVPFTFPTLFSPRIGLIIIKVNIDSLERVIAKFLKNYFTLTIVLMATAALKIGFLYFVNNVKHMHNWRKEKRFGNIDLNLLPHRSKWKGELLILTQKYSQS